MDDVDGLIDADDLGTAAKHAKKDETRDETVAQELAGMSAREINRAKRLAKQQLKSKVHWAQW